MADRGDLKALEEGWIDLAENPPQDPEFYVRILKVFQKAKSADKAHDLFLVTLEELKNRSLWKPLDQVISALAPTWKDSARLRALAEAALRGRYAHQEALPDLIAASKITGDGPIDEAIKRFRSLLRLTPGQVFQHASWGEGIVRQLDLTEGKVVLDFPTEPGKAMKLEGVRKFLTYLKPSDFLARRVREPEKIAEMAKEDPAGLVKLALQSVGGRIKHSRLKALLMGSVVPEKSWASWWTRARRELQHDPYVDIDAGGGANAEVALRDRPKTVTEEAQELFFDPEATLAMQTLAVRKLTEVQKKEKVPAELVERMIGRLTETFKLIGRGSPARVLEYSFLYEELAGLLSSPPAGHGGIPMPEAALRDITEYEALNEIENVEHGMRAFELLFKRDGAAGIDRAAQLLPEAPVRLAQAIWKELGREAHQELAAGALEKLLSDPLKNPSTYFWAVKMLVEGNREGLDEYFTLGGMVNELLAEMESWNDLAGAEKADKEQRAAARQLLEKTRTLLAARHYAPLCEAVETMTLDQALRLRRAVQTNKAVNEVWRAGANKQLRLTRKDLNDEQQAASAAAKSQALLCTARAKEEKTRELQHIRAVRIPTLSHTIEEARREGDLKENAGYHAAKDEQKILMQHMLQLQEALSAARTVSASEVSTEAIAFGTTFEAKDLDQGQNESYTILGRWEADPERRIISIQAPLAEQFLGKRIGDEFTLSRPDGSKTRFKVLSIQNALATGEWEMPASNN